MRGFCGKHENTTFNNRKKNEFLESDFLGLGGGWGLYEPPQEQENKTVPVGFLGLWFATFIFTLRSSSTPPHVNRLPRQYRNASRQLQNLQIGDSSPL